MDDRDTKFQGFAKLLWQEMLNALDQMDTDMDVVDGCSVCSLPQAKVVAVLEPLIARHAYDLVYHSLWNLATNDLQRRSVKDFASTIPDLTAWPEPD